MRTAGDFRSGIVDIKDSLILKENGDVYALLEIPAATLSSQDEEGKVKHRNKSNQAFLELKKHKGFELYDLSFDRGLEASYERLAKDYHEDTLPLADVLADRTIDKLNEELVRPYHYRSFIVVPLKDKLSKLSVKAALHQAKDKAASSFASLLGKTVDFPSNWHTDYQKALQDLMSDLALLNPQVLTTIENKLIQRLQYLPEHFYDVEKELAHLENSVEAIDESKIYILKEGQVGLLADGGFGYQKHLPIIAYPDLMNGFNLQELRKTFNFPVDFVQAAWFSEMKGTFSPLGKSRRADKKLKNAQVESAMAGGRQKRSVAQNRKALDDLEEQVDLGKTFLESLGSFVIYGQSPEEIAEKESLILSYFSNLQLEISSGRADQEELFVRNRMTEGKETKPQNFLQTLTTESFAEQTYFTDNKVGSDIGFYLGRVVDTIASFNGDIQRNIYASNKLVFYNLFQANKLGIKGKLTNNGHVAITGETGSGKSFLTKLLFSLHSLLKAQLLYLDPKSEIKKQYMQVLADYERQGIHPEICDYIRQINFVTLQADDEKNHGVLDPLVFLSGSECKDLAETMVAELLGDKYESYTPFETAFLKTLEVFMEKRAAGQRVGMLHVFEALEQSEDSEISNLATLVLSRVHNSILQLAFSHGQNQGVDMNQHMTVLEVSGLDLPKDNAYRSKQQTKSLVLMYALGYFCKAFGARDKTVETAVFVDEAWFMASTEIGANILKEMRRVGRSMNNFLVMITQSVKDLYSEDDSTGFGTVFAFLEPTEVDDILAYLHVPNNEATQTKMRNMTLGECFFKDPFGRVERMVVDGQHPELTVLFDTVESSLQSVV